MEEWEGVGEWGRSGWELWWVTTGEGERVEEWEGVGEWGRSGWELWWVTTGEGELTTGD